MVHCIVMRGLWPVSRALRGGVEWDSVFNMSGARVALAVVVDVAMSRVAVPVIDDRE